jgi:hypothetical protein
LTASPPSSGRQLRHTRPPARRASGVLQARLAPLHRLVVALQRLFGERSRVLVWLNSPNAELGGDARGRDRVMLTQRKLHAALASLPAAASFQGGRAADAGTRGRMAAEG